MPTAFGSSIVSATFDPTNRPMYNPADITKSGVDMWIAFIEGVVNLIPGAKEIVALVKELTGIDLLSFERVFEGIDLTNPGSVLAAIENAVANLGIGLIGQLIKFLGGGGITTGSPGTSSTDPLGGLIGFLTAIPLDLLSLLLGGNASQQSQIDSLASGGFSYDPAVNGVSGWTTLTGTALALSTRGVFIQPNVITVAYRSSGISSDKYGVAFQIDPTMRGVTGYGICADSAGASWVGLLAYRGSDGDALRLVYAASPTLWVVVKEFDLAGNNRLIGLTTLKLRTDGVNQFWAEINGHPVTWNDGAKTWTDSGALVTHNSTHRGVVLVANGSNTNEDASYGPAIRGKANSYAA